MYKPGYKPGYKFTYKSALLLRFRMLIISLIILSGMFGFAGGATAHPLGNFTINHFSQLTIDSQQVTVQSVVDMAEIPAFQALQSADIDHNKSTSEIELKTYLEQIAPQYAKDLSLEIDQRPIPLRLNTKTISLPPGAGGLPTLRMEWEMTGAMPDLNAAKPHRLKFEDRNDPTRIGWREIVINPNSHLQVFNSSVYSNSLTNALRNYPQDLLTTPLQEAIADLSFTAGEVPADAMPLVTRQGDTLDRPQTILAQLKNTIAPPSYQRLPLMPDIDWNSAKGMWVAIAGAFVWGAMHSLSPGHGKTLVGAYLIGTRATTQHAFFLALTTTITHTIGVFALGLITLFAAEYILPEQLYPWLSLISGMTVVAVGFNLFAQRLRTLQINSSEPNHEHFHGHHHHHDLQPANLSHSHEHSENNSFHSHVSSHSHGHHHDHSHDPLHQHSHKGAIHDRSVIRFHSHEQSHSHLPPGADGSPVTWRNLLALGISGGLMPCPAALVLLLGSIALGKVTFGLQLVFAFSLGLAGVLTGLGLLLIHAKQLFRDRLVSPKLMYRLPAIGALCMAIAGLGISTKALLEIGGIL